MTASFYAPVQLPHGVTVTKVTSYWYDVDSEDIYCVLVRTNTTGSLNNMAFVSSSGSAGDGSTVDTTIPYSSTDNSLYQYTLYMNIDANSPTSNLRFRFATIEFVYPT